MNELPAGLADPLHLLPSFPFGALAKLLAFLLFVALWILWRWLRRRLSGPRPKTSPRRVAPLNLSGVERIVDEVRRGYQDLDPRKGCHVLSTSLREHLEKTAGRPFTVFTTGEILAAVGAGALASFFELLAELQFRRRPVSREEFLGVCDLARESVTSAQREGRT